MINELIEIYVRTDVDIYTDLEEACRDMWLTVGPTLHCFTHYLLNWSNIIFQVSNIIQLWTSVKVGSNNCQPAMCITG